jgi:hypothetical protein
MPSREERLARNEVRFREINESAQPHRETQGGGRFVCECADRSCLVWIDVPTEQYVAVRQNPRLFVVAPTHEMPDIETVVERQEGYFVVEKPDEVAHVVEGEQQ